MSQKALMPIEQKTVEFYEDTIIAVRLEEGVYIPIKPICTLLGIQWSAQLKRINRDPVLKDEVKGVSITDIPGGTQTMSCLPLKYISGFLFGVNAERVKQELKERVIRYQRECYDVLAEAFHEGRLTANPVFEELLQENTPEVQAYKMIMAMAQMARQQILLRGRIDDHEQRLEALEAELGKSERFITRSQATEISQAVKAIAMELSKRSGHNEYGGVYGELYRHFEIPSYRELPASRFDEAIKFLNDWLQALIGTIPF